MDRMWVFGYGSLIWRPAFEYQERRPALIRGFTRRFWQASTDHRGTPEAPGRVVTLVEAEGENCHGMAYCVSAAHRSTVIAELDHREKGGYRRVETELHLRDGDSVVGLVYIASEDNPHYVGPAPLEKIAAIARSRHGPSGANRDYVLRLAAALEAMDAIDDHVYALARLVADE